MTKDQRQFFPDFLRTLAIIGVVAIHADTITSSFTNYVGGISWWLVNIVVSFSRAAVPLFIMLSGYLLLSRDRDYSSAEIRHKVGHRIGIPLIFWTGVFYFWEVFWRKGKLEWLSVGRQILSGNIFHLYFLVIMIGLYLATPYLRRQISKISMRQLWVIIVVIFSVDFLGELTSYLFFNTSLATGAIFYFLPYTAYFLSGYTLGKLPLRSPGLLTSVAGTVISGLLSAGLTFWNIGQYNAGNQFFWTAAAGNYFLEHFSLTIILLSLTSFYWLRGLSATGEKCRLPVWLQRTVTLVAATSFGIYLVHPIVLQIMEAHFGFAVQFVQSSLWLYFLKKLATATLISTTVVWLMRQTQAGRWVLGES